MKTKLRISLFSLVSIGIVLMIAAGCGRDPAPSTATSEVLATATSEAPSTAPSEVASGREPNASVSGTVTYRERLALTPSATLVVKLQDVSYQDAASPVIASQTVSDPGQVPIKFKIEYNRDDIDSRNTYSINAKIIESDGRLAFTNDTTYEVITGGNPNKVDMLLVLVQPPPDLIDEGEDWRTWVETPVPVLRANLIPNEPELLIRIAYLQPTIEGCVRRGSEGSLEVDGNDIIVRVTLMQPPQTPWAIPCHEQVVELHTILPIETSLESGQTYTVIANGQATTTFALPKTELGYTFIAESPIESVEVTILGNAPPQYQLRVVSGLPKGSGCSQFNGYEVRRPESNRIDVAITHHEVADPLVACITDYPIVETIVPLGSDFEPGEEYTISVNSETTTSFVAQ